MVDKSDGPAIRAEADCRVFRHNNDPPEISVDIMSGSEELIKSVVNSTCSAAAMLFDEVANFFVYRRDIVKWARYRKYNPVMP